ncbi:flagellar protein FliT [Pseudohalioglobus lutimaris]|uniref:Flagellar protein FliT n=1 Tax=Pseudohalioglobus lutimaris TaxID=1737061 RepID=A0A2N5X1C3_9GAMM|nr:flagellar protein FliT [Pseudohalioglobus lutimaris]PLW68289.1 flagellar protein FliT [Pseudohalioglobus lutimaris]
MNAALTELQMHDQVASCRRLATVLEMTRRMVACADAGDWESVAEIERERRDDLKLCFSQSIPLAESDVVAEALAVLLHLNEELMARLKVARETVMRQGREFSRKRSALSSYQGVELASRS